MISKRPARFLEPCRSYLNLITTKPLVGRQARILRKQTAKMFNS